MTLRWPREAVRPLTAHGHWLGRELDFLHHLAYDAVGHDHGRGAVFEGKVEAEPYEVGHLLDGGRSQNDKMIVAVAASLGGLEIVTLAGLDGAETGASAHNVDDQRRKLAGGDIADSFLHEADARRRARRQHGLAGRCAAIDHVDGRNFALGLQDNHARGFPRHKLFEGFEDLALRGDGVAEIAVGAITDGGVGQHFVALHQPHFFILGFLCHCVFSGG